MAGPVARDHYAILGVTPTSEDVVIRAAYRALMRRYHPDADPSSEASQKAQAINAAYAVLSDPEKRARYDGSLATQRMIGPEPAARSFRSRFLPGPAAAVGLAAMAAAAAILIISSPLGVVPPDAVQAGDAVPRKASAGKRQIASAETQMCDHAAIPSLLKSELLHRAASTRGADRERLEQAGGRAVLRADSASERGGGEGAASCSAMVAIDLPPGLTVEGGRTNLNSELTYGVSKGADGAIRLASLSGAGRLIRSLATLAPAAEEQPIRVEPIAPVQVASARSRAQVSPQSSKQVGKAGATASRSAATELPPMAASSCRLGNGWAERTICSSGNLTALDRQLGLLYGQSLNRADDGKRAVLLASRDRFQQQRSACRSESCLTSAYVARLREISEIMARRSQQ